MWRICRVGVHDSIKKTIEIIDNSTLQIALVVDNNDKLLGTVTDGDVRRAILNNIALTESVKKIMNSNPMVIRENEDRSIAIAKMRKKKLQHLPVIDRNDILVGLISLRDLAYSESVDNSVVLMVGGLGSRLRPLTNDCPKPLLKVGNKPILEIIISNFIECGFCKFYLAVNYKAEMIESYFGDGSRLGVEINYLHEVQPLGTAGALSLLPHREKIDKPLLVMNGDLLTKVNFKQLLDFHTEHRVAATMGVRAYNYQIPYGVVNFRQEYIDFLEEKPVYTSFVNAGIYVLNPDIVQALPEHEYVNMPDVFNQIIHGGGEAMAFPIREYWLDIGQMSDFQKAQGDFREVFK